MLCVLGLIACPRQPTTSCQKRCVLRVTETLRVEKGKEKDAFPRLTSVPFSAPLSRLVLATGSRKSGDDNDDRDSLYGGKVGAVHVESQLTHT
jgi:hypothetical protein